MSVRVRLASLAPGMARPAEGAAGRLGRPWPALPWADVALAVLLAVVGVALLAVSDAPEGGRAADGLAYAMALALTLPIAGRRLAPVPVLAVVLAAMLVYGSRGYADNINVDFFGPVLAFYTVVAECPRRVSLAVAGALAVVVPLELVVSPLPDDGGADVVTTVLVIGGTWLLGDWARQRRLTAEQLAVQAEELRAARLTLAEQAVSQERLRIARELHDVVAHHMSVIVVQAALAQDRLETDPGSARRALDQVEAVGRGALREMRQILGVLRPSGSAAGALTPAPGLADVEGLCAIAREGGIGVTLTVEGAARQLPPSVDLAAYRIVQEALTNVVKHAPGAQADLVVRYEPRRLQVSVVNGPPPGGAPAEVENGSGGHGLDGMRERAGLLHGAFEAGSRPGGGFAVRATLPLEAGG